MVKICQLTIVVCKPFTRFQYGRFVIFDTCYMKQFMQVVAQVHQLTKLGAQMNQRFIEAVWLWEYPLFLVLCLNK